MAQRTSRWSLGAIAALAVLALFAAACDGDDDGESRSGAPTLGAPSTPVASDTASVPAPCPEDWVVFAGAELTVCAPPDNVAAAGEDGALLTVSLTPGEVGDFALELRRIDVYAPPASCAFGSDSTGGDVAPFPVAGGRGAACTVRTETSVRFSGQLSLDDGAVEFNAQARDITQLQLVAAILETVSAP